MNEDTGEDCGLQTCGDKLVVFFYVPKILYLCCRMNIRLSSQQTSVLVKILIAVDTLPRYSRGEVVQGTGTEGALITTGFRVCPPPPTRDKAEAQLKH